MVRPREANFARRLEAELLRFAKKRQLRGITTKNNRVALIEQVVESTRRIKYVSVIAQRDISPHRADPTSELFDPIKAAILHQRQGNIDESFWLVFLSVHFGRNARSGWRLVRDVYGALGSGRPWDWPTISKRPGDFRKWLAANQPTLKGADGIKRAFGNHRKYETIDSSSPSSTANVIESYVKWVNPPRTHGMLIQEARQHVGSDPRKMFGYLYGSMDAVERFGRTARFDYLTMAAKVGLAPIEPGSTYMQGATGPLKGARLLFGGSKTAALSHNDLEAWLVELEKGLTVGPLGMQVLEDALCNWQKSPSRFKPFRS